MRDLEVVEEGLKALLVTGVTSITKNELLSHYEIGSLMTVRDWLVAANLRTDKRSYDIQTEILDRFHHVALYRRQGRSMAWITDHMAGKSAAVENEADQVADAQRETQNSLNEVLTHAAMGAVQQSLSQAFDAILQPEILTPMIELVMAKKLQDNKKQIKAALMGLAQKKLSAGLIDLLPGQEAQS